MDNPYQPTNLEERLRENYTDTDIIVRYLMGCHGKSTKDRGEQEATKYIADKIDAQRFEGVHA